MTSDGVVVVNHDGNIGGVDIQSHPYSDVQDMRLVNEERMPTLDEYLLQGMRNRDCKLVLELKPHATAAQEDALVEKCIVALKTRRLFSPEQVAFISFSRHICRELARKAPGFTVQYLEGDAAPSALHAEGINGIDYHYNVFYKHPEWVKEAHDLGMSVNVWTVDRKEDIENMRDLGVDQITTNDPALTREILWNRK
jgi:glycerophosphoryl diester phosphodiesterase